MANPYNTIVVLTDEPPLWENTTTLLNELGISVGGFQSDSRVEKLRRIYKHSSVNGFSYELHCFLRFLYLDNFVTQKYPNASTISLVDSDIATFDPLDFTMNLKLGYHARLIDPLATYYSRFSREGLHNFTNYIISFYDREPEEVLQDISVFGSYWSTRQNGLGREVKKWYKGDLTGIRTSQFSDMFILRAWLNRTTLNVDVGFQGQRIPHNWQFVKQISSR